MAKKCISIRGAREHNLKGIDIDIPRDKLVVFTGLSGSGKSSLAFDTIYAEGQRKYIESLSAYARQFLDQLQKPDVDEIQGLPPTIAIQQRSSSHNPRSTVATTTEIYDYLRLLFARIGQPHCWHKTQAGKVCLQKISSQSASQILDTVMAYQPDTRLMVIAPLIRGKKGEHKNIIEAISRQGFVRARIDGRVTDLRNVPTLDKNKIHTIEAVVDRIAIKPEIRTRLADSIEISLKLSDGIVIISTIDSDDKNNWIDHLFSEKYACPKHPNYSLEELSPRLFSFNSPYGACPQCHGLGTIMEFNENLIVPDTTKTLAKGAIIAWRRHGRRMATYYARMIRNFCKTFNVSKDTPFQDLHKNIQHVILHGTSADKHNKHKTSFEGVIPNLQRRWQKTDSEWVKKTLMSYMAELPCNVCQGTRLKPEALHVFIDSDNQPYNINDVTTMTITRSIEFFNNLRLNDEQTTIAQPIIKEIDARLKFMTSVGLDYLTLDRRSSTLSGGEAQRIRLATQVGSGLVGCAYVLDEPTIGLHQRDNNRLISTLKHLAEIGNTVLVVEHDEETIRAADYIIDIGPGPGRYGGQIVTHGKLKKIIASNESITAQYLTGKREIPLPQKRRRLNQKNALVVKNARENNLDNIDVTLPLNGMICVTGVSGSGKSTLINQILLRGIRRHINASRDIPGAHDRINGLGNIDRVIEVDQSPIGRTPRSNPATYTGTFDLIRNLFAMTKEAKIRGYKPGRFSFNVKGGRCEVCQGQGTKKIEMHFLPDVYVKCEQCKGKRYNRETLDILYKGRNIAQVLDMTIEEALDFFDNIPRVAKLLKTLCDVGLGYVHLGQSSTTLSGGEAQRVKLAAELGKSTSDHTVYILDEPTTGLHFDDIQKLLNVLNRLLDINHTVIIIEHNLDVIKCADWIIDLGPEGGDQGGQIVAQGTPEDIAANPDSYTGQYLAPKLNFSTKIA